MTCSLTTQGVLLRGEAWISQLCIINRTYLAFPRLFQWSSNDLLICLLIWICRRSATYSNTVNTLIFYANVDAQGKIHMLLFQSRGRVREWFMMWRTEEDTAEECPPDKSRWTTEGVCPWNIHLDTPLELCIHMPSLWVTYVCVVCFFGGKTWFAMCHMIPTESAQAAQRSCDLVSTFKPY